MASNNSSPQQCLGFAEAGQSLRLSILQQPAQSCWVNYQQLSFLEKTLFSCLRTPVHTVAALPAQLLTQAVI